jgi:excinuclease ABC subunit A
VRCARTFLGVNAADILAMTVSQARALFQNQRRIARPLGSLERVGLGYLHSCSPRNVSGGRKRSASASRASSPRWRPPGNDGDPRRRRRGLHPADTKHLLDVLDGLVDAGLTLVSAGHEPARARARGRAAHARGRALG